MLWLIVALSFASTWFGVRLLHLGLIAAFPNILVRRDGRGNRVGSGCASASSNELTHLIPANSATAASDAVAAPSSSQFVGSQQHQQQGTPRKQPDGSGIVRVLWCERSPSLARLALASTLVTNGTAARLSLTVVPPPSERQADASLAASSTTALHAAPGVADVELQCLSWTAVSLVRTFLAGCLHSVLSVVHRAPSTTPATHTTTRTTTTTTPPSTTNATTNQDLPARDSATTRKLAKWMSTSHTAIAVSRASYWSRLWLWLWSTLISATSNPFVQFADALQAKADAEELHKDANKLMADISPVLLVGLSSSNEAVASAAALQAIVDAAVASCSELIFVPVSILLNDNSQTRTVAVVTAHEPFVVPAPTAVSASLIASIEKQIATSLATGSPVPPPKAVPAQLGYVTARLAIPRGVQCTFTQRLTAQSHAALALAWLSSSGNTEQRNQLSALIARIRRYADAVRGAYETDVVLRRFVPASPVARSPLARLPGAILRIVYLAGLIAFCRMLTLPVYCGFNALHAVVRRRLAETHDRAFVTHIITISATYLIVSVGVLTSSLGLIFDIRELRMPFLQSSTDQHSSAMLAVSTMVSVAVLVMLVPAYIFACRVWLLASAAWQVLQANVRHLPSEQQATLRRLALERDQLTNELLTIVQSWQQQQERLKWPSPSSRPVTVFEIDETDFAEPQPSPLSSMCAPRDDGAGLSAAEKRYCACLTCLPPPFSLTVPSVHSAAQSFLQFTVNPAYLFHLYLPPMTQIPVLSNRAYSHGSFFGATPGLLADETWRRILARLMPDVHEHVVGIMRKAASVAESRALSEQHDFVLSNGAFGWTRLTPPSFTLVSLFRLALSTPRAVFRASQQLGVLVHEAWYRVRNPVIYSGNGASRSPSSSFSVAASSVSPTTSSTSLQTLAGAAPTSLPNKIDLEHTFSRLAGLRAHRSPLLLHGSHITSALINSMENNPVVAAFGALKHVEYCLQHGLPIHPLVFEWDIFLSPKLLSKWRRLYKTQSQVQSAASSNPSCIPSPAHARSGESGPATVAAGVQDTHTGGGFDPASSVVAPVASSASADIAVHEVSVGQVPLSLSPAPSPMRPFASGGAQPIPSAQLDGFALDAAAAPALLDPVGAATDFEAVLETAIAHGNVVQSLLELVGYPQYENVLRAPKTSMGGVSAKEWLVLFAEALRLAQVIVAPPGKASAPAPVPVPAPADENASTASDPMSVATALRIIHDLSQGKLRGRAPRGRVAALDRAGQGSNPWVQSTSSIPLSIALDIKSRGLTPQMVCDYVRSLNQIGIHVAAVGSFNAKEIEGVGRTLGRQHVRVPVSDTESHLTETPPPLDVIFYHFVGNVQEACLTGRLKRGDHALFNGGSLLRHNPFPALERPFTSSSSSYGQMPNSHADMPFDARMAEYDHLNFVPDLAVIDGLRALKAQVAIHLGMYIQETVAHHDAIAALVLLCNKEPALFDLGFAFGGLDDSAAGNILTGGTFATVTAAVSRALSRSSSFAGRGPAGAPYSPAQSVRNSMISTGSDQLRHDRPRSGTFDAGLTASGAPQRSHLDRSRSASSSASYSQDSSSTSLSPSSSGSASTSSASSSASAADATAMGTGKQSLLGKPWKLTQ
ncbi:hypothetical protein CAOG_03241 [Capsaspora owczarzaki ATCC 30864]|uniref:Uncharacterized protein n=2 Tax=Capsaspora owczarzaki (strain ATCC 30864) TaxID=595528 RepID=A0A0D2UB05_CAPO3|nr:hypothetical protein CAOG_03241 [Capsaspora owczarzaki ATCC 30864]KJE92231.1 hypothetical protein, variant 1 [Capsaspora owczarzaki ATCC 30864]|eukprot:XP_004364080.1 hypothetical protein CAOG_03241 [Capsaspora owczarzaki ATCC 30864]